MADLGKVVMTKAAALGNGTRPKGFVLGSLRDNGQISRAAGVQEIEIETARRNPGMTRVVTEEVVAEVKKESKDVKDEKK